MGRQVGPGSEVRLNVFRSKYSRAVTLILLLQAVAYYAVARREEQIPVIEPLNAFPAAFDGWREIKEYPVEKEVQDVLRADDTLNRVYLNPGGDNEAFLFIALFKTQRYGQSPHSPKNCLPGSGWETVADEKISLNVSGWNAPIVINRYIVEHGDEKSVTLYWYQSHNRVIASELKARLWLVADAVRYHRSDTALIRVISQVHNNNIEAASNNGIRFIQSVFPQILAHMAL